MTDRRVALVTGASRGIGAAVAERLSRDHFVIGTATSSEGALRISERLGEAGEGIELRIDDDDSVASAFARLAAAENMPAVLVNNAGITR